MATDVRNINNALTDDATFRAWAQSIHDALIAAALVQTADTGQINFATALRPAVSTYAGYAVYRMNDSGQASSPIFVKVEYGVASANTRAQLAVTYGRGSNGAGTLTNPSARTINTPNNTAEAVTYTSATEGGFFHVGPLAVNVTQVMGCARIRDSATGAFRPEWIAYAGGSGLFNAAVWNPATLSWTTFTSSAGIFHADVGAAVNTGGNATDAAMCPGLFYNGLLDYFSVLAADPDDVTLGSPFTITMPEGQRTFMALDSTTVGKPATNSILCIPWE